MTEYSEDKAIEYIRKTIGTEIAPYDDDQILNVIDLMWDWQEDNGFLDLECEDDPDEKILAEYIVKMLKKDSGNKLPFNLVPNIIKAEFDYENTLM